MVSGGAGASLKKAAEEGVDTFVTGEGPHWTYALAEDLGLNVLYGGHYATETFGVKALAAHLSGRFKVPWCSWTIRRGCRPSPVLLRPLAPEAVLLFRVAVALGKAAAVVG